MDSRGKMSRTLSLKRAEISLNNFNQIAIPHLLELLRKHKENIRKFQSISDLDRIKNEQINATRVVKQLKHLLEEIEYLRQQIIENDLPKFDQMIEKSKNLTNQAIKDYMDLTHYKENVTGSPSLSSGYSSHSPVTCNNDYISEEIPFEYTSETISLQVDDSKLTQDQLQQQEECLKSWEALQNEVRDLHELFVKFGGMVHEQAEPVNAVEQNVETSSENVQSGLRFLRKAERFKTAWYPIAGALIGGCIAGPVGLVSGLKIGGLAVLSGTALGFTSGKILKKKREFESSLSVTDDIDLSQNKKEN